MSKVKPILLVKKLLSKYKKSPVMFKASFWFLVCSFFQKGIQVITTPIFTRLMTPAEYGVMNVFQSWEGIISIFCTLNLFYGVYTQGLVKFEHDQKKYSSSLQGLTLILVAIWTIIYFIFSDSINDLLSLSTPYMVLMLTTIWISAVFQFWASEQRVNFKYRTLVLITIASSIISPLLSIIFMQNMEDKVFGKLLGYTVSSALFYAWMFFYQVIRGKKIFFKKYWIHALRFNIPLVPHYLAQTILSGSDRIMIEKITDSSSAGIYGLAYSISLVMTIFNNALMQTISPWIYKKIKHKQIGDIAKIAYTSLFIVAGVNIILIALAPEVVAFFAPSNYHDAIWVIPPVAMSVYFMYSYDLFAKFAFYYEKTKLIAVATVASAVLNIALNFVFINLFGYIAAGYTTLACYIFYSLFHYLVMRSVCRKYSNGEYPYDFKIILGISTTFVLCGFLMLLGYNFPVIRYIVICIILLICIIKRTFIINQAKKIFDKKE